MGNNKITNDKTHYSSPFIAFKSNTMKRLYKRTPNNHNGYDAVFTECDPLKLMGFVVVLMICFSVLFSISVIFKNHPTDFLWSVAGVKKLLHYKKGIRKNIHIPQPVKLLKDSPLGDLIPIGFDKISCLSRHQSLWYRKETHMRASPNLISKLRNYEDLHKKCGPHTKSYNETVEHLKSGKSTTTTSNSDCRYLVWISFSGLGNRIMTLASAFLYAILTSRVLLVDRGVDIHELFCEPFPETSWLLPLDFPLTSQFSDFNQKSSASYGNLLKSNTLNGSYAYLHLVHDYDDQDKLFFCNHDQINLQNKPWLLMKSDNYFVPALFLAPHFEQELHNLFPDKETVFHLLGLYLFHPTNAVWGLITRYYQSYLSQADLKVGIQIRVFGTRSVKHVLDQILACTTKESILPQVSRNELKIEPFVKQKNIVVLLTSLSLDYFEEIRNMYWRYPTITGEAVSVHQPSHEGYQKTDNKGQNKKAWAEMYLLSLMDKLVTSSWSTFGYVAQGLGGLKPWILYKPENETVNDLDPPCGRVISIEPCFHSPPFYGCKMKRGADTGAIVPHVKHCEDMSWGLKLIEPQHSEL